MTCKERQGCFLQVPQVSTTSFLIKNANIILREAHVTKFVLIGGCNVFLVSS